MVRPGLQAEKMPDMSNLMEPFFQPLTVGRLTIPNRIAMSPMTREFAPGGVPGADIAEYYRKRTAGGVGLIVTEGAAIDYPGAVDGTAIPHLYGEAALAGWRGVAQAVHAEGGTIVPQLWHQGPLRDAARSALPNEPGNRPSGLWGTPGVTTYDAAYVAKMVTPTRPMTESEIADIIAAYGRSARFSMEAGFDGIAIHGAHGYLIDSFFWADTNRRTDRWGGSTRARAEFGVEIVKAVRAEIGEDKPIIFRFSQHKQQDYNARFAETPEELGVVLGALADAGVDLFDASIRRFTLPAFEGSDLTLPGWAEVCTCILTAWTGAAGGDLIVLMSGRTRISLVRLVESPTLRWQAVRHVRDRKRLWLSGEGRRGGGQQHDSGTGPDQANAHLLPAPAQEGVPF